MFGVKRPSLPNRPQGCSSEEPLGSVELVGIIRCFLNSKGYTLIHPILTHLASLGSMFAVMLAVLGCLWTRSRLVPCSNLQASVRHLVRRLWPGFQGIFFEADGPGDPLPHADTHELQAFSGFDTRIYGTCHADTLPSCPRRDFVVMAFVTLDRNSSGLN